MANGSIMSCIWDSLLVVGSNPTLTTNLGNIMKVDIETIRELKRKLDEINSVPFEDIEFFENGKRVGFDKNVVADWKFIGLNNVDFITTGHYKSEWEWDIT